MIDYSESVSQEIAHLMSMGYGADSFREGARAKAGKKRKRKKKGRGKGGRKKSQKKGDDGKGDLNNLVFVYKPDPDGGQDGTHNLVFRSPQTQ